MKSKKIKDIKTPRSSIYDTKNIGQFIMGEKLGEGTFGKVKKGTHILTGEKVAIKILEKNRILEKADKVRVEREIKILKMLKHHNIVELYSVIQTPTTIFLIMELSQGKELFEYIVKKRRLDEEEAASFFLQIISAVQYLHNLNISHRDLKPENLLLNGVGGLKLVDFGLSNFMTNNQLLSTACGSPCYAAPEMLEGNKYEGNGIDIWSCGIILYAMVCGYLPFEDKNNDLLYKKIKEGKFAVPSFVSESCKDLIKRILVTNPLKRIKLSDILRHSWLRSINPNLMDGLIISKVVIPIDEDIIRKMEKYGFSKEESRANVLSNKHNQFTTTYYLLLKVKLREGENSISDMKSDLFFNYINDKRNLISNYNDDMAIVLRERNCSKPILKTYVETEIKIESNANSSKEVNANNDSNATKPPLKLLSTENISANAKSNREEDKGNNKTSNISKVSNKNVVKTELPSSRKAKTSEKNVNSVEVNSTTQISTSAFNSKEDSVNPQSAEGNKVKSGKSMKKIEDKRPKSQMNVKIFGMLNRSSNKDNKFELEDKSQEIKSNKSLKRISDDINTRIKPLNFEQLNNFNLIQETKIEKQVAVEPIHSIILKDQVLKSNEPCKTGILITQKPKKDFIKLKTTVSKSNNYNSMVDAVKKPHLTINFVENSIVREPLNESKSPINPVFTENSDIEFSPERKKEKSQTSKQFTLNSDDSASKNYFDSEPIHERLETEQTDRNEANKNSKFKNNIKNIFHTTQHSRVNSKPDTPKKTLRFTKSSSKKKLKSQNMNAITEASIVVNKLQFQKRVYLFEPTTNRTKSVQKPLNSIRFNKLIQLTSNNDNTLITKVKAFNNDKTHKIPELSELKETKKANKSLLSNINKQANDENFKPRDLSFIFCIEKQTLIEYLKNILHKQQVSLVQRVSN